MLSWIHRRTLNKHDQISYISAVKRVESQPDTSKLYPSVRNRFDDFQGVHINRLLFRGCIFQVPVFDPVYGFEGSSFCVNSTENLNILLYIPSRLGGSCVSNGPFQNIYVNLHASLTAHAPEYLTRDFSAGLTIN